MKRIANILLISVLLFSFGTAFSQTFNTNTDLLLANFDLFPDDDDVQAAAALGCILKHSDYDSINYYAVAGAYGIQDVKSFIGIAVPDFFNTLFGSENGRWTNAHSDWSGSVNRVTVEVVKVLNQGGKIFVQEAGQSDFTYDVCQAAIAAGVSSATIKTNVIVVQHSLWNENNTTTTKLTWVKANTIYVKIADGNTADNGSPAYKDIDTQWMTTAMSASNPNEYAQIFWTMADQVCDDWTEYNNPEIKDGGVDFSDCSENWHIFNWDTSGMTVESFWDMFVTNDLGDADFAPLVSFVSPTDRAYIDVDADIPVLVTATDDSIVSNVKLYLNDTLVSQKNTAPYLWSTDAALSNMAAGTYVIKAVAQDNVGQTSSTSVTVTVRESKEFVAGPEVYSNYIVCEMENTNSDLDLWELITPEDASFFAPEGSLPPINNTYVEFTGNTPAGTGTQRSPLEYTFICPKSATYELYMRLYQRLDGQESDKCNDVYIKMAGDFTSVNSLITTEELKQEEKFFGNGTTNWGVGYKINKKIDNVDKYFPAQYKLTAGEEYTLTIAGRSQRTCLDYWILIDNTEDFSPAYKADIAEVYDAKFRATEVNSDPTPLTGVTLNTASATIASIGKKKQLSVTFTPSFVSSSLAWSSSNDKIASVSQTGLVIAEGVGEATITVISVDGGFTDSCIITSLGEPYTDSLYPWLDYSVSPALIGANKYRDVGGTYVASYDYTLDGVSAPSTSNTVLATKFTKIPEEYIYSQIDYSFPEGTLDDETVTFKVRAYFKPETITDITALETGCTGITLYLRTPGNVQTPQTQYFTTTNQWEELTFTFTRDDLITFDKILLMFAPGYTSLKDASGAALLDEDFVYYIDYIESSIKLIDSPTSSIVTSNEKSLYISPNPARYTFSLSRDIKEAALYNLSGKEVAIYYKSQSQYDISHLPKGVYVLRTVLLNGSSESFKLMKE